jgi:hypothetical protein
LKVLLNAVSGTVVDAVVFKVQFKTWHPENDNQKGERKMNHFTSNGNHK